MFKIQIFHPESGFYLNTNHQSEDLEALKSLLKERAFAGPRYQIVDQEGTVHYGPICVERNTPMSIEDLAQSLGVPVRDPRDLGLSDEAFSTLGRTERNVGYTLQAVHEGDGTAIVSLRIEESQACEIMRELWAGLDFWGAPGGGTVQVATSAEAETINEILGKCWISLEPGRHRWLFHVHLD